MQMITQFSFNEIRSEFVKKLIPLGLGKRFEVEQYVYELYINTGGMFMAKGSFKFI